jgi:hypothetical protein
MSNSTPGTERAASPPTLTDAQMRIVLFATLRAEVQSVPEEPYLLLKAQETEALKAHSIGAALYVGKNPQNLPEFAQGLELGGDSELSRQHFRIVRVDDSFVLEDLGSTNGTYVNTDSSRLERHWLTSGDCILAGQHLFIFVSP